MNVIEYPMENKFNDIVVYDSDRCDDQEKGDYGVSLVTGLTFYIEKDRIIKEIDSMQPNLATKLIETLLNHAECTNELLDAITKWRNRHGLNKNWYERDGELNV